VKVQFSVQVIVFCDGVKAWDLSCRDIDNCRNTDGTYQHFCNSSWIHWTCCCRCNNIQKCKSDDLLVKSDKIWLYCSVKLSNIKLEAGHSLECMTDTDHSITLSSLHNDTTQRDSSTRLFRHDIMHLVFLLPWCFDLIFIDGEVLWWTAPVPSLAIWV